MRRWMWLALALASGQLACEQPVEPVEDCGDLLRREFYVDDDYDGFGAGSPVQLCVSANERPMGYAVAAGDCAPQDAQRWRKVNGLYRDADGDGRTVGGPQSACLGREMTGWLSQRNEEDCDDASRDRWALMQVYADADGDGAGEGLPVQRCAGTVPPPGYVATATDCAPGDGLRWQLRPYSFRDVDGDGASVAEEGEVCSGPVLPEGYSVAASALDCDDSLASRWQLLDVYKDTDGDGVGIGPVERRCSGQSPEAGYVLTNTDCAPDERLRWQQLSYLHRDADGDGATVPAEGEVCSGLFLPEGYYQVARGSDCDDANPFARVTWSLFPDEDRDGVGAGAREPVCAGSTLPAGYSDQGTDCAPYERERWQGLTYRFRDADADGFTVEAGGSLCAGATLPPGYRNSPWGNDCDDENPTVHHGLQLYADADGDTVGAGEAVAFCTDGSVPAGYSPSGSDCAPDDSSHWQVLTYSHVDVDGDGYTTPAEGQLCAGAALPPPYFVSASGNDCNDTDPSRFHWTVLYPDADGDGVGVPPRVVPCLGTQLPAGHSIYGFDPDDADPTTREPAESPEIELILDW
jgi:hypothetical protein